MSGRDSDLLVRTTAFRSATDHVEQLPFTVYDGGLVGCVLACQAGLPDRAGALAPRKLALTLLGLLSANVPESASAAKKEVYDPLQWIAVLNQIPFTLPRGAQQSHAAGESATPKEVLGFTADPAATAFATDDAVLRRMLSRSGGAALRGAFAPGAPPFTATTAAGVVRMDRQTRATEVLVRITSAKLTAADHSISDMWNRSVWDLAFFTADLFTETTLFNLEALKDPTHLRQWEEFINEAAVDDVTNAELFCDTTMTR
ncbi:MAG TPA: hypothetical protein VM677_21640 [Actinokineospora sp.]|jgi:hypothetical protein|nr:hypothetical protein [Actinokineospora sp.]